MTQAFDAFRKGFEGDGHKCGKEHNSKQNIHNKQLN